MPGAIAGVLSRGKRLIRIDGGSYHAGAIAWLIKTGRWPHERIDFKNGDRTDLRWSNLREATASQAAANKPIRRDNASGFKGVSWSRIHRKWVAEIQVEGERHSLGYFDDPEAAHTAYWRAAQKYFGEFARTV